ncbi:VWA domain-containing protein [Angustibacter luteus]|uniref:VWA domain-containing protein n=1 Tax=Angustibacter luteus TaxID=658456 RepID=A0ABW1JBS5_9ACTN
MSQPLLRGVDRAAFAASLTAKLRAGGVAVGLTATEDLTRALAASLPTSPSRLYWVARVTLVRRQSELAAFDAVFAAVFDDAVIAIGRANRTPQRPPDASPGDALMPVPRANQDEADGAGLPWVTLPSVVALPDDPSATDADQAVPLRVVSELEALSRLPFEQLSEAQTQLLGRWLEQQLAGWPTRRTRRRRPGPGGREVALRPTIARSRRTGWDPVELVRVRPVRKPRRVVVLCDVSQSMQPQVTPYVHLMRALVLGVGGEAFAFATSLTRLTTVLRHRSAVVAVEQATAQVSDRYGGTRIAASVQALLASHHAEAVRGGVVVIGSDGWDSEPPQDLARAMARLRRRAYRVVWINPRAAAPGFEPLVGTMAAALPYCDDLLAADTFDSLAAVVAELGSLSSRA